MGLSLELAVCSSITGKSQGDLKRNFNREGRPSLFQNLEGLISKKTFLTRCHLLAKAGAPSDTSFSLQLLCDRKNVSHQKEESLEGFAQWQKTLALRDQTVRRRRVCLCFGLPT